LRREMEEEGMDEKVQELLNGVMGGGGYCQEVV